MKDIKELEFTDAKDVLKDVLTELKTTNTDKTVKTSFKDLDYVLGGGLHNGDLIVLAGRPAMGKTTLGLNMVSNVAKQNIPVAVFSLEMSKEQYIKRIIYCEALVDNKSFYNKEKLTNEDITELENAIKKIAEKEILINDTQFMLVNDLKEKCIKLKQEKNIGLILIDDLQSLYYNEEFRIDKEKTNEIMKTLNELSKELNIPIVIICNYNKLELRENTRPNVYDLEQCVFENADIVLFLYRDDYYNEESEKRNIAEIIVTKNKYGYSDTSIIELAFLNKYFKFVNLESPDN